MLKLKENDLVYTPFGYGIVITMGKKYPLIPAESKSIENAQREKEPLEKPKEKEQPSQTDKVEPPKQPEEEKAGKQGESQEKTEENDLSSMVSVKLKWGGVVYLEKKFLKKKITIHIKTFFGQRKTFAFELDINTTIQQIKTLVIENSQENAKSLYNLRVIYPMGMINELNSASSTLENYKIPDKAKLVLLAQTTFFFDPNLKGNGIKLSNNNLTANKNGESDYQTVLGNMPMRSGRHYWEIKIEKYVDEEDIMIGICEKGINLYTQPTSTNQFWGYLCLCAKRFGSDGVLYDYGYVAKHGDVIGVLLEFKSGVGTLSFYKNGTKCGVAFNDLKGVFHPAVCMFYGEVQVTLDPKAQTPLN